MNEEKTEILIVKIIYVNNSDFKCQTKSSEEKLRTKAWLEKISEIMDFRSLKEEKE
jgi:hypothetical protein